MAINPLSYSYVPYSYTECSWSAVHTGYSEIAPDAAYVESDAEWTGTHTSYEDVYIPSEPEVETVLPNFQAMLAAVNAPTGQNLDNAIETFNVSSDGTVNLTLQRDSSARDSALPLSTTSVHLSVAGTDISTWELLSDGSPNLNLTLPGLPSGIHTVEVEAWSNGRLVGTTRMTVTVAEQKTPAPEPTRGQVPIRGDEPVEALPTQTQLEPEQGIVAPRRDLLNPAHEWLPGAERSAERKVAVPPSVEPEEGLPSLQTTPTPVRVADAYPAGQAMAGGLGLGALPSVNPEADRTTTESVPAVKAVVEADLQGRGGRQRPPWPAQSPEEPPDNDEAVRRS